MRRLLLSTVIAIACVSAASADTKVYNRSGNFENYYGYTNEGKRLCGLMTNVIGQSAFKNFHIKSEGDGIYLMLFKDTWQIPTGTKVPVEIGFDGESWGPPVNSFGETRSTRNGYSMGTITVRIKNESLKAFLDDASHANRMFVRFGGNEPLWSIDMTGSRDSLNAFGRCITSWFGTTQPYSAAPSQPYGSGQQTLPQPTTPGRSSI